MAFVSYNMLLKYSLSLEIEDLLYIECTSFHIFIKKKNFKEELELKSK